MADDTAPATVTDRFIEALRRLEQDGDVEPLVGLYGDGSVAGNLRDVDGYAGAEGAREFWTMYRRQFGDISSTFDRVVEGDGAAALEWTSTGTIDGRPVTYRGVTMIESADGSIRRTCAYFDPTALA